MRARTLARVAAITAICLAAAACGDDTTADAGTGGESPTATTVPDTAPAAGGGNADDAAAEADAKDPAEGPATGATDAASAAADAGADTTDRSAAEPTPAAPSSDTAAFDTAAFDTAAFETAAIAAAEQSRQQTPGSPGAALRVLAPGVGVDLGHGIGALDPAVPLRVASNTKTFVAAAVMRLVELGELSLDQSLADGALDPDMAALIAADGYDLGAITVADLLVHAGGLHDYAVDPAWEAAVAADPRRQWTAVEQIEFATRLGDPLFEPGIDTAYSDTGYLLLASVLEGAAGEPLGPAVRRLVGYDTIGLEATWWEALEPAPSDAAPPGPQLLFGTGLDFGIPREAFSPHIDLHGGGGLVASIDDLARFSRALWAGEIFDDPAIFDQMTGLTSPADPTIRAGVFAHDIDGVTCFGHLGYWGTAAHTCPAIDVTVAFTAGVAYVGDGPDPLAVLRAVVEAHQTARN
ncbi:MAG: serine hydrolase domain-containing protein [Acidimicrobiales bacterium]